MRRLLSQHDNKRAREVCAGLEEGEVVVFDKAYVDFEHLHGLDQRGVQWVTRAKDNLCCRAVRNLPVKKGGKVVKDQVVKRTGDKFKHLKGWTLRRVEAWVEVDGELRLMVFITNHTTWSAGRVCDLYRARWDIEVLLLRAASRRSPLRGSLRLAVSLRSAQTGEADAQARRLPRS